MCKSRKSMKFEKCIRPLFPIGNMFQYPQWIPETANRTEPYIYCYTMFLFIH